MLLFNKQFHPTAGVNKVGKAIIIYRRIGTAVYAISTTSASGWEEAEQGLAKDEKLCSFDPLDTSDPGIAALTAVLELAGGASVGIGATPIERLLLTLFINGMQMPPDI
jgi:hypothetical protein